MSFGHQAGLPSQPKPWGYLATLGWAALALVLSNVLTIAVLWVIDPAALDTVISDPTGSYFGLLVCLTNVIQVVVIVLAARLTGWSIIDYLGLTWPSRQDVVLAVTVMGAFVLGYDALAYLLGSDVVSPFQIDVYRNAQNAGSLVMMWLAMVVYAPVGEELLFRGFLYRGWVRAPAQAVPAILVISAIWAAFHIQYDWLGILQIVLIGLILGWTRWRSGSTLLTMLLHGLINAWATFETMMVMNGSP